MSRRDNSQSPSKRMGFFARILGGSPKTEEASPAAPAGRTRINPQIPPSNSSSFSEYETRLQDPLHRNSDSTALNSYYQQPIQSPPFGQHQPETPSALATSVPLAQTPGTKRSAETSSESQPASNKRRRSVLLTTRGERVSQQDAGATRSNGRTTRLVIPNAVALQRPKRTAMNGINLALTREQINQRSNKRRRSELGPPRAGPRHGPRDGPPPNRSAPTAPSNLIEQVFQRDQQSMLQQMDPAPPQASSSRSSSVALVGEPSTAEVQTIFEPQLDDLPADDTEAIEAMIPAVQPTRVSHHVIVYSGHQSRRARELHAPLTQEAFDENETRISNWLATKQSKVVYATDGAADNTPTIAINIWAPKPKTGIWKCTACRVENLDEQSTKCISCESARTSNPTSNAAAVGQISASGLTPAPTASLQSRNPVGTQTSSSGVTAGSGAPAAGQITSSGFSFPVAAAVANPFGGPSVSQEITSAKPVANHFSVPSLTFGAPGSSLADGSPKPTDSTGKGTLIAKKASDSEVSSPPPSTGFISSPIPAFKLGNGKSEEGGGALVLKEGSDALSPSLPSGLRSSPVPAFQFRNREREDSSAMSLGSETAGRPDDGSKVSTSSFTFGASKANSTADNPAHSFVFNAPAKFDSDATTGRAAAPSFAASTGQSSTDANSSASNDAPVFGAKVKEWAPKSFGVPVPGPTNGLIVDGQATNISYSTTKPEELANATADSAPPTQAPDFSFGAVGSQNTLSNPFGSTKKNKDAAPSSNPFGASDFGTSNAGTGASDFGTSNTTATFVGSTFGSAPAATRDSGFGSEATTGATSGAPQFGSSSSSAFPSSSPLSFGSSVANSSEARPPISFGAGFGSTNTSTDAGFGIGASGFGASSAGLGSGFGASTAGFGASASNVAFSGATSSTSGSGFGASSATAPAFSNRPQSSAFPSSAFPPVTSAFPPPQAPFPTAFPNSQNSAPAFPQFGNTGQSFGGAQATSFAPSGPANPTSFGQANGGFGSMNGNAAFGATGQQHVFSMGRSATQQPTIPGRRRLVAKRPVKR